MSKRREGKKTGKGGGETINERKRRTSMEREKTELRGETKRGKMKKEKQMAEKR